MIYKTVTLNDPHDVANYLMSACIAPDNIVYLDRDLQSGKWILIYYVAM